MKNIRKLYFQNAAGSRWGLNGENGVYASMLAGFGVTLTPVYADLNRGFFTPVSDEAEPQTTLPFTITFTRAPYETYQQLIDWLSSAGTITIVYDPTGQQEFYRDVTINFLQKGEKTQVGWLEIPASFFCSTPWYLPAPTEFDLSAISEDETKRYDYSYGGEGYEDDLQPGILGISLLGSFILGTGSNENKALIYGDDSSATLSGTVAGAGHVPGALELTYRGSLVNPRIRLVGNASGKTYGICAVDVTLAASDALQLSTRYENSYVRKISADGEVTDLLDVLNLSLNPFFHIPVEEPCTLSIEADAAFTGKADMLVYYYFRSV